ncbi:DNA recombination protein RmuC [[Mycoplasma] falconis]|uniref:DNA recombination protein RmuC n=1 Tax=[Mycoplasma] falconis TaxID=92403 RepID=A0A501XAS9_9BACT|nr:DNA recombination protein RmuC [[Mycoplasma] falconis]TPE57566.1 DNA recombination protein RmuC [[Mycoplasma] falconis]
MEIVILIIGILALLSSIVVLVFVLLSSRKNKNNNLTKKEVEDIFNQGNLEIKNQLKNDFEIALIKNLNSEVNNLKEVFVSNLNQIKENINNSFAEMQKNQLENKIDLNNTLNNNREIVSRVLNDQKENQSNNLNAIKEQTVAKIASDFKDLRAEIDKKMENMISESKKSLETISTNNKEVLNQLKNEIDEYFQSKLQKRLNEHFGSINEQMTSLTSHLTQFETVQNTITEISKTMTNNKTRGVYGEVILENILYETFGESKYCLRQVDLQKLSGKKKSSRSEEYKVDFAIQIPIKGGIQYLPIDAKFPTASFLRYLEADEQGDINLREKAEKDIKADVKEEVTKISSKYIIEGFTTDEAIMFIPSEALFAFIVSKVNLKDIYEKYKIIIAGPTTILFLIDNIKRTWATRSIGDNLNQIRNVLIKVQKDYDEAVIKMEEARNNAEKTVRSIDKTKDKIQNTQNNIKSLNFNIADQSEEDNKLLNIENTNN